MIRRDRTFAAPRYQGTAKAEKAASAGQSQAVGSKTGPAVAAALEEMTTKGSQMATDIRESRRTLQVGQGVLAEVKDSLSRLAELAQKAAEGGEVDREALQSEMEQLREEIGRMIGSASVGDVPLFLDEGTDIKDVAQLLMQILGKAEEGISPDQAIRELTGGAFDSVADLQAQLASGFAPGLQATLLDMMATGGGASLLKLLAGMQGGNLDLLMNLLSNLQTTQTAPEGAAEVPPETAQATAAAPETPEALEAPVTTRDFGPVRVTGQDLSGVAFDKKTGELTVSGKADVTVQGTGQEVQTVRITGSGTATLRDVAGTTLTVESAEVRVDTAGQNVLGEIRLGEGKVLI